MIFPIRKRIGGPISAFHKHKQKDFLRLTEQGRDNGQRHFNEIGGKLDVTVMQLFICQ